MSDRLDALFEGLRGQPPPAPFAPPEAVRRRGRQRAQRQAVLAGVALFAVTGLGAGGIVTVLGESPQPVDPASPSATEPTGSVPTTVPQRWLLTTDDLPGSGWSEDTGETVQGAWYWDGAETWCPEYRVSDYPSLARKQAFDVRGWRRDETALAVRVDQVVELFEPGVGEQAITDVRNYLATCSRRPEPGDQAAPTYYEIESTGFAGDESLLIRVEPYVFVGENEIEPAGEATYVAVVRVGDVVTTISYYNLPDDEVIPLVQRAADRLG